MHIYWVETPGVRSVAIVPRPRGDDWLTDEIKALRRAGIDILVSLLTESEQHELGLTLEAAACEQVGIRYVNFPVVDRGVPTSSRAFGQLITQLQGSIRAGKTVGAHCRAGIGRSSMLLAAMLCSQGLSSEKAFALLSEARGMAVPDTQEQVDWVKQFAHIFSL
jgi:protein-tyrosine phosphatase